MNLSINVFDERSYWAEDFDDNVEELINDGRNPLQFKYDPFGNIVSITDPSDYRIKFARRDGNLNCSLIILMIEKQINGMFNKVKSEVNGRIFTSDITITHETDAVGCPPDTVFKIHWNNIKPQDA